MKLNLFNLVVPQLQLFSLVYGVYIYSPLFQSSWDGSESRSLGVYSKVAKHVNLCPDVHPWAAMSYANLINITIVNSAGTSAIKDIKSIW